MATLLRFPDRIPAASPARMAGRPTAEVVILPCIRREQIGVVLRTPTNELEQLQA